MKNQISDLLKGIIKELFNIEVKVELSRPDEKFGDYATNISLKLASQLQTSPTDIAQKIANKLKDSGFIESADVAAGFINIRLKNDALVDLSKASPTRQFENQTVVVEYSDANPFKVLHAGHLYTSIVGDAIANLFEVAGANVHRVNFGGDVGLHVAKSLYAISKNLDGFNPDKLETIAKENRADWLSERYIEGNKVYEEDDRAKKEIADINAKVYELVSKDDHDSQVAKIYWVCRQWSYDYFDEFYQSLGIKFEKYYPESAVFELGLKTVRNHVPKVYQESQGAIVFKGEDYGLFTNVFINSQGLPTYSAKDVGLIIQKWQDYHFDHSVIITANEQLDYMRVVLKSIEQFNPDLTKATLHLTHGEIKLAGGVKMSSRLGNFLKATDIIEAAMHANKNKGDIGSEVITIGAVKYSFLKQAIGPNIIYDPDESVSLEGNSGPYLQYAHVRASNILRKAAKEINAEIGTGGIQPEERSLLLKVSEYNEALDKAVSESKPHYICTYLYELAQKFNAFYENNRVLGDQREEFRLQLVSLYLDKLANGLAVLGISTPDKM